MIALGLVLCLGCYFIVRRVARRWLLGREASGEKVELAGPVGIVREVGAERAPGSAGARFALMLLAHPIALVWPIVPLVELLLTPRRRRAPA